MPACCTWVTRVGGVAQSLPPRPFPKIPAQLLRDFSQYGSVFSIAAKCAEVTRQRGAKKVDWQNPAKRKEVRARRCFPCYIPRSCWFRCCSAMQGQHALENIPQGLLIIL